MKLSSRAIHAYRGMLALARFTTAPDALNLASPSWFRASKVVRWNSGSATAPLDEKPTGQPIEVTAQIDIYGEIGWDAPADVLVRQIRNLPDDVTRAVFRLHTPGGDVDDGLAIYNAIRELRIPTVAIVDGAAHSAGSFIAMAADELHMPRHSEMMIHEPWGCVIGDADDARKGMDSLNLSAVILAGIYAEKQTGKPQARDSETAAHWRGVMRAETWFGAEEAVNAGIADKIIDWDDEEDTPPAGAAMLPDFREQGDTLLRSGLPGVSSELLQSMAGALGLHLDMDTQTLTVADSSATVDQGKSEVTLTEEQHAKVAGNDNDPSSSVRTALRQITEYMAV